MLIYLGALAAMVVAGLAAWTDLKSYRIPNRLVAWLAAIGVVFATWRYSHPEAEWLEYRWGSVTQSVLFGAGITVVMSVFGLMNAKCVKRISAHYTLEFFRSLQGSFHRFLPLTVKDFLLLSKKNVLEVRRRSVDGC